MKALQLHYTSCRRGQSGNAGFQTRALTPGIRPDEQREIERRGIYRPPRDASPEPTPEEIAHDFPLAFRSCRLESGRLALIRSGYTGRDYSGRWGNFFAHTLVLEDGVAPPLWPIDLFEWSGWINALEPGQDTEQAPSPLPWADLGGVRPAESFRLPELRDFLGEQSGRPELLARMARGLLLGLETSRALVVRDSATNVLYWIACLQKLFPASCAWALSSSSYQDDPRGCADLNGTTGETGFTFDDSERRYRFYMFDLAAGQHSEAPANQDDYPAVVSRWLAQDPGRLERFFAFMQRFKVQRPTPDLISAVHLFELSEGPAAPGGGRLAGMVSFAARYATPQGRADLLEVLGRAGEELEQPEDAETLVRFLADAARQTGKSGHRELALRGWLSLVRRHVLGRGQGLEAAKAAWSCLPEPDAGTAALVLQDPLWSALEPLGRHLSPETLVFLLQVLWTSLETLGRRPAWDQPEFAALIQAATVDPLGQALLAAVPRQPETLAAVSRQLAAVSTPERAGRALGRVLATCDPAGAQEVRCQLDQEGGFEILTGEWREILDRARQPASTFAEYQRSVLSALPRFERRCGVSIRKMVLEASPEPERVPLAISWLREQEAGQSLPEDLAASCVRLANLAVPLALDLRDGDDIARLVAKTAASLKLPLQPDRPFLRNVLGAAQDPKTSLAEFRLKEVRGAVPGLRPEEYETFLAAFLAPALGRATTRVEHQSVLLATFTPARIPVFERLYLDFFQAKRKITWSEDLQASLRFWLGFDPRQEELRPFAALEKTARKGLVLALGRLKPERLDGVRQNLKKARLDQPSSTRWRAIEEALEASRRGPWARFVGLFARD